jgi:hypothetical protein
VLRVPDLAQMGVRNRPHKRRKRCVLHENVHEGKMLGPARRIALAR